MVLAGNCALESMGFETFGFGGGRADVWEPEEVNWGAEAEWLGDARYSGDRELENPLGAVQMGLIYVNPEGPNGNPDPLAAARDIRETFARMAMNDEETVALIAGGHTFGKTHGAADPNEYVGREPEAAPLARAGPRLEEPLRHRQRRRHDHQRPRGHLDADADDLGQQLLRDAVPLRVGARRRARPARSSGSRRTRRPRPPSPTRTTQRRRTRRSCSRPTSRCGSTRSTSRSRAASYENPQEFADAFARAWFKLTHRDMGPIARYLGPEVPSEQLIWQDPVPAVDARARSAPDDVAALKAHDPRLGPVGLPAGLDRVGVGVDVPRHRQARRRQRCARAPRSAERLGRQRPGRAGHGAAAPSRASSRSSTPRTPAASRSRSPTSSCSVAPRRSSRPRRTPASTSRCRSPRVARTRRRSRPTSTPSPSSSRPPTGSATTSARATTSRRSSSSSTRRSCSR